MGQKHHDSKSLNALSRRHFIKQSAFGVLGLSLSGGLTSSIPPSLSDKTGGNSKIILVKHSKVVDEAGKIQQPLLQEMLNKAITTFTGKNSLSDSWLQLISPEDVIGLKLNTLGLMDIEGTDYNQHFPAMVAAIASSLQKAGVKEENLVVWDRSEEELKSAGFAIQKEQGRMRVMANNITRREPSFGFNPKSHAVGDRTSRVSRILADMCTALINIPVIKTHSNAIFTCALKNHYGSIDNPREFHATNCTEPGIPEVNAIPVIRNKQRLIICDALLIPTESGPRWRRRFIRPYGGILVGTDPVAVDTVALKILDQLRMKDSMTPISGHVPHIPLSEKLGLGTNEDSKIEIVNLDLG